ncbi:MULTISPECIES: serine hydrolase [unclassified Actinotalea]|uniref:serine hydrolase domain-containing protein n=1 Tax=unclassified Actinotalea TaxID=2638618 RepID=UPI0015F73C02|nr:MULTISPECIES: serine hydrolase [unclassified Actinotalea]
MPEDDLALPRVTPEEQGVASTALLALVDALEAVPEPHGLVVVTRGAVVAEGWWAPYGPERPHQLFSLSKTFTAIAVGLAEAEGLLSVDDLLLDHLSLEEGEPDPRLARMRLEHLLTMTTGHHEDTTERVIAEHDWVQAFLSLPVEHEPGTHFVYNTTATAMLSAVVQRVTGQRLLDYLTPRLLDPLGIAGATWEQAPTGFDAGGFGLAARTEDVARLGELLRCDGVWRGRRLLPEGWVARASAARTPSVGTTVDWDQGYGYQLWRGRHGSFRGDGAFGQFCVVLPDQETVVAITGGTPDMQGVLDAIWAHLLPAVASAPLPPDPAAHARLVERLGSLRHDPPLGRPPHAGPWRGAIEAVVDPNPSGVTGLRVMTGDQHTLVSFGVGDTWQTVPAPHGRWHPDEITLPWDLPARPGHREPVVAAARVDDHGDLRVTVRLIETPFVADVRVSRDDEDLTVTGEANVAFGPTTTGPVRAWVSGEVPADA